MGRPCSIEIHKLVEMLPNKQYCRCILCDKTLSGAVRSNIKRHYERLHPEVVLPKAKKRKHLTHLKASSNKVEHVKMEQNGKVTKLNRNRVRKCIVDWNSRVVQALVENVRKNENLWNPHHCFYKDRIITRNAWENVSAAIDVPKSEAILKWHSIRSSYRTHLKNLQEFRTGQIVKDKKPNPLYSAMSFLDSVMKFPPTTPQLSTHPANKQAATYETSRKPFQLRASDNIWDGSLRKMEPIQALIAGKLISSVLIQGQLGQLSMSSNIAHNTPRLFESYQLPRIGCPTLRSVETLVELLPNNIHCRCLMCGAMMAYQYDNIREHYESYHPNMPVNQDAASSNASTAATAPSSTSQSQCNPMMPIGAGCGNDYEEDTSSLNGNGQFESVDIGKEELCEVVHSPEALNDSSESFIYPDNPNDEDPFIMTNFAQANTMGSPSTNSTPAAQTGNNSNNATPSCSMHHSSNDASFLQYLSDKFGKYSSNTKYTVQYHINCILYKADMGCYDNADASKLPDSYA
ncbi:uncharacterized protein [Drosophila virilis]|uniref:uncharacterized protein isoform X1 n=1 Tax=Drosophila virilis TaxID=7244 RepID=UPI0038B41202